MGDPDFAQKCLDKAAVSIKNYEKICWNGDFGYYTNDVTESNCQHSYGPGCTAMSWATIRQKQIAWPKIFGTPDWWNILVCPVPGKKKERKKRSVAIQPSP